MKTTTTRLQQKDGKCRLQFVIFTAESIFTCNFYYYLIHISIPFPICRLH